MNLSVIIVNYRTAELAIDCIASIASERTRVESISVVLVDNASPDDSAKVLAQAIEQNGWGSWVVFLQSSQNGGFAVGNNLGIRFALETPNPPSNVLLLNPDTLVRPRAIGRLVEWMEKHPNAGIVGGRLLDADNQPQCSGFRFPSVLGELESGAQLGLLSRLLSNAVVSMPLSDVPISVDWVSGACFLIRRSVIDQIGLLDEKFFMYYEEVDYCRRAKQGGWKVWYVPEAQVVHLEGAASGINDTRKPRPRYWYDSRRRYFAKNQGKCSAMAAEFAYLFGLLTFRIRRRLQRKPDITPKGRFLNGWRFVILPLMTTITSREQ